MEKYRGLAADFQGWERDDDWLLYKYPLTDLNLKSTSRKQLALLANQDARIGFVKEVVSNVRELRDGIKNFGFG